MKKYWKLTSIIVVIVLSIGTFYVTSALSAEPYPEFVIQAQSGDAKEIESLVLEGAYAADTTAGSYIGTNVKISEEGSTYASNSFLDQVIGQPPTLIKELREEYRSFMRGKNSYIPSFFENEQFIAYAADNYQHGSLSTRFFLDLSVLNKEDASINTFTIEIPDGKELDYFFVEDVQMIEDELYVITKNAVRMLKDHLYYEEHIYTIDVANQKISSDEAIIQVSEEQKDIRSNVHLVPTNPTQAMEQLIFIKTDWRFTEDEESRQEKLISQEVYSYDLHTKETTKIDVPGLQLDENRLYYFDGSTIYFMSVAGEDLAVTPYSLVDHQVGQLFRVQLSGKEGLMHGRTTLVKDGKLYVVSPQMTSTMDSEVVVADVKTGETLFKGQLALKDPSEKKKNFELAIHEVYVK
ncbi:hypothetical protein [Bacillus sp. MRMR6]|uniref:hypothetical protein n=1 Tax=Bacillus sp. MRMR6 TaxID=1928617 RepID=UPI0009526B15|nr:hypothetical protein [Bacillus sp. MRMR6]OLS35429.1 hypothetical protein BTR25_19730 [Bacillus sp. MRMR6]